MKRQNRRLVLCTYGEDSLYDIETITNILIYMYKTNRTKLLEEYFRKGV